FFMAVLCVAWHGSSQLFFPLSYLCSARVYSWHPSSILVTFFDRRFSNEDCGISRRGRLGLSQGHRQVVQSLRSAIQFLARSADRPLASSREGSSARYFVRDAA